LTDASRRRGLHAALLEGAYAFYTLTHALAYGGSQTTWLLVFGFGLLAGFSTQLARAISARPSRRMMAVSLAAALGHLAFAIRGLFLGPEQPFLILGAVAIAVAWISFRARSDLRQ
jgi:hypothetical protein